MLFGRVQILGFGLHLQLGPSHQPDEEEHRQGGVKQEEEIICIGDLQGIAVDDRIELLQPERHVRIPHHARFVDTKRPIERRNVAGHL